MRVRFIGMDYDFFVLEKKARKLLEVPNYSLEADIYERPSIDPAPDPPRKARLSRVDDPTLVDGMSFLRREDVTPERIEVCLNTWAIEHLLSNGLLATTYERTSNKVNVKLVPDVMFR